jgi:peroxin-11B
MDVNNWIKFTSTTVGRDKLYRTIQYVSKFLAFYLAKGDALASKETIEKITKLGNAVGIARKLFRVGKPIDFLQTMIKALTIKDDVIRWCTVGRAACLGSWLALDSIQWLHIVSVIKVSDFKSLQKNSARFWFYGLLFAVAADLYRVRNNFQRQYEMEKAKGSDTTKKELATLHKEKSKVIII